MYIINIEVICTCENTDLLIGTISYIIATSTRDPCMHDVHDFYILLFDLGSGKRNSFELGMREAKGWFFSFFPDMSATPDVIGKMRT